ncbi:MAG: glycosyltransferase family 39 protein [Candidatus Woesearchaeota archaeon]
MGNLFKMIKPKRNIAILISICLFYLLLKAIIFLKGKVYFDEGVYLGIAKYFASAGQAGYFESLRPLALSFILTPFQWLPLNQVIVGRIISLVLIVLCILLVYHITKKHFGEKAGLWSILLFASSYSIVLLSGYILTDIPAYVLALWSASLILERKYLWGGLALGAGFLFKFPVIIILPILVLFILFKEKKKCILPSALFSGGVFLSILPYFMFNLFYYSGHIFSRLFGPLTEASSHIGNVWVIGETTLFDYLKLLAKTEIILLLALCLFFYYSYKKNLWLAVLLLACASTFLIYFSVQVPRFDERYLLSALPFLAVLGGAGLCRLAKKQPRSKYFLIGLALLPGLVAVGISLAKEPINTDQEIQALLIDYQGNVLLSNSGFVLPYASSKVELTVIPYFARAYQTYWLDENIQMFSFDPDEYPNFEQQFNYVLENNNISGCGYLHGFKMVILTKEEGKIGREECLNRIGYNLTTFPEQKFFVKVDFPSEEKKNEDNIQLTNKLLEYLIKNKIHTYLEIDENLSELDPRFLEMLEEKEIELAFNPQIVYSVSSFKERISNQTGIEPICIADYWQQDPCRKINLYLVKDWSNQEIYSLDELKLQLEALSKADPEIGIDIPGYILTEEKFLIIKEFIDHLADKPVIIIS